MIQWYGGRQAVTAGINAARIAPGSRFNAAPNSTRYRDKSVRGPGVRPEHRAGGARHAAYGDGPPGRRWGWCCGVGERPYHKAFRGVRHGVRIRQTVQVPLAFDLEPGPGERAAPGSRTVLGKDQWLPNDFAPGGLSPSRLSLLRFQWCCTM